MATLQELVDSDILHAIDPNLPAGSMPNRLMYASDRLKTWLENVLIGLGSTWQIELSPSEQAADLIELFCSGEELHVGHHFKCLQPTTDGVWELKTPDLRIFGWFAFHDTFIGHCADTADRIKLHALYNGYIGEVDRFRAALDLNPPKFIAGSDPNVVVSNYSFP